MILSPPDPISAFTNLLRKYWGQRGLYLAGKLWVCWEFLSNLLTLFPAGKLRVLLKLTHHFDLNVIGIPPCFSQPVDSKCIKNGIWHTGMSLEVISCLFVSPEVIFRSMKYLQPSPNFLSFQDLSVGLSHCLDTLPAFWNSPTAWIIVFASEVLFPLPLRFPIMLFPILDSTFSPSLLPLLEPHSLHT